MTRRTMVGSLALAAAVKTQLAESQTLSHSEWKPRLGVLGPYTPANVEFAKVQLY